MENTKPNNPQAFPSDVHLEYGKVQKGMTLRDYFANSAMQSYIKEHLELLRENKFGYSVDSIVESSYLFADAMLKQREL